MQLRSTIRLPGRYREDDVPDIPGKASFIHPTVPYNPNLPPAIFPTLDYPRRADARCVEVMAVPSHPESPESDTEQDATAKRAIVFHGKQQSSDQWLYRRLSSDSESEEVRVPQPEKCKLHGWDLSVENATEPGEYDGWEVMANDDGDNVSLRIGLSVYEPAETWSQVTDGLKLIIIMDLMALYSFKDVMKRLMLTDEEKNEVRDLFERETMRQAEEDEKIARSQAYQLKILMNGGLMTSREASSASYEYLYENLEDPPTFMIKKTDIVLAQRFLKSVKLKECADRLWRFEGVTLPPIFCNVLGLKTYDASTAIKSTFPEEEQDSLVRPRHPKMDRKNTGNIKSVSMIQKVDKLLSDAKSIKRPRIKRMPISSKLPSGLRNSISGENFEETLASGPTALQAAFSPHKQLESSPQQRPVTPRVRFVKKSTAQASTLKTSPKRLCNTFEQTPDSPIANEQTRSLLADQAEPYTPLPTLSEMTASPMSTPSRVPKIRLTPSQAGLTKVESILSKKPDIAVALDKRDTVPTLPPMGAPPEILHEKTRSASMHADAELTPQGRNVDNDARRATQSVHMRDRKANKLFVPAVLAQGDGDKIALPQKKRKFQGPEDSPYRASGEKRSKIGEQGDGSHKVSGQKRQDIQGGHEGTEHLLLRKENKGRSVAESAPPGTAAVPLIATKIVDFPPTKTINSNAAPKEKAKIIEDGEQAGSQKQKMLYDARNESDL